VRGSRWPWPPRIKKRKNDFEFSLFSFKNIGGNSICKEGYRNMTGRSRSSKIQLALPVRGALSRSIEPRGKQERENT